MTFWTVSSASTKSRIQACVLTARKCAVGIALRSGLLARNYHVLTVEIHSECLSSLQSGSFKTWQPRSKESRKRLSRKKKKSAINMQAPNSTISVKLATRRSALTALCSSPLTNTTHLPRSPKYTTNMSRNSNLSYKFSVVSSKACKTQNSSSRLKLPGLNSQNRKNYKKSNYTAKIWNSDWRISTRSKEMKSTHSRDALLFTFTTYRAKLTDIVRLLQMLLSRNSSHNLRHSRHKWAQQSRPTLRLTVNWSCPVKHPTNLS